MRRQGRAKALHHNDNHHDTPRDNNGTAAGVLDPKRGQPRRAEPIYADTRPDAAPGVHA
jgi:hypothetical protein